jgi:hypothetical protein
MSKIIHCLSCKFSITLDVWDYNKAIKLMTRHYEVNKHSRFKVIGDDEKKIGTYHFINGVLNYG